MNNQVLIDILKHFPEVGQVDEILPLTSGLINRTYKVKTADSASPDYILQCINHNVFTDVPLLQRNIELVTAHIRKKLIDRNETDIDRKVLRFLKADNGSSFFTLHSSPEQSYWRVCAFIPDSVTLDVVTPETSYLVGLKFGEFQAMLADIPEQLGETIPDFHNVEFRYQQLQDAVAADKAGRLKSVQELVDALTDEFPKMCFAENDFRAGKLCKRICHCDTKVSNMLFDKAGNVLCVIDLDTTMPSFVFSDFGDFLRSAANTAPEDEPDLNKVSFRFEIFQSFSKGYIEATQSFLTPNEKAGLPYSVALFPYMQAVRFFTDYLNGDTYYHIDYLEHNLVRTKAQLKLYYEVSKALPDMSEYINSLPVSHD